MKRIPSWLFIPLVIGWCAVAAVAGDVPPDVATLADGNNAFALDLYAQLAKTTSGNVFFSPYSIRSALAMTYAGARGETADQMRKVLHFSLPDDRLHAAFAAMAAELNSDAVVDGKPAYELSVANALWGQARDNYNSGFRKLLRDDYGADLHEADFITDADRSRQEINQWVEKQTHEKILGLIGPGVLERHTRFVLASAVYFKGNWATQFDKGQTQIQPFHLDSKNSIPAPLMFGKAYRPYMETSDLQAVELPYLGDNLRMLVLLPRDIDGIKSLERSLDSTSLKLWEGQLHPMQVEVFLPKFQTRSQFDLPQPLASLGMIDPFDGRLSDFSGICGSLIYLSNLIHATYLNVNEEGTEAAAVTATVGKRVVTGVTKEWPLIVYRADHPFLYLIQDGRSGAILFMGRVLNSNG